MFQESIDGRTRMREGSNLILKKYFNSSGDFPRYAEIRFLIKWFIFFLNFNLLMTKVKKIRNLKQIKKK